MRRLVRAHPFATAVIAAGVLALAAVFLWSGTLGRVLVTAAVLLAVSVGVPAIVLRGWWRVAGGLAGAVGLIAVVLVVVKLRYGGGEPYPDLRTPPEVPASALGTLVALDYPPGNVAIASDGRTFFNYHPFAKAERFVAATMFELVDGAPRPYPDAAFQARYQGVFGMTVDRQQRLWLIEPAGLDHDRTRLLAFDLRTNKLAFEYWFPAGDARFAQDLRVAADGATVFLASTGLFRFSRASLIVFDIASRSYRSVLETTPATQPQDWVIRTPLGPQKLAYGLITFAVGLDGIELSRDGAWLYFGAMSHERLFEVPTAALRDPALAAAALDAQVVEVGRKPLSDGITVDAEGRVLITDIEHGGIAQLDGAGQLTTLVSSPAILWADGVVVAPDGAIVFTDSAIPGYIDQLGRPPAADRLVAGRPYRIYRVAATAAQPRAP